MSDRYSRIIATGSYLPEYVRDNQELEKNLDTTDEWIYTRTGIRQRHIAAADQSVTDLAEIAAKRALRQAELAGSDIDMVIVATTTPERIFPSTACLLQHRLGSSSNAAFDIQAVCSGFIYALSVADKFIHSGEVKTILVVGAEVLSRIIDWQDRNTCILFGDGAGAVVLRADNTPGILQTCLHADGSYADLLTARAGSGSGETSPSPYISMQGREVFRMAVELQQEVSSRLLSMFGMHCDDIDWLVPHQANIRIIKAVAERLQMPLEKVVATLEQQGNTSAASIPLALDRAVSDGRLQSGHKVLSIAMGGGFTWGAALFQM